MLSSCSADPGAGYRYEEGGATAVSRILYHSDLAPMKYSLRSLMRFSIRDLVWLTVVVALAVAWWADRRRLAAKLFEEQEFRSNLRETPDVVRKNLPMFKRVWGELP